MSKQADVTWTATLEHEGRVEFRVGRSGDERIAEWPGLATLRANVESGQTDLSFGDDTDARWRAKLERGLAHGMLRQLRGGLALHASAVAIEGRGALLVGPSGAGKSTLAAMLVERAGAELIADDASAVTFEDGDGWVEPTDTEVWLWPEARQLMGNDAMTSEKRPVELASTARERVRIASVFVLEFGDHIGMNPIRGHRVLSALVAATIRLVVDEPERQLHELALLDRLVSSTTVRELVRPRDFSSIDASMRAVVDATLLDGP
ncbi:MAG: AAA family ATPase [Polyangiaceae bacterium]